MMNSNRYIEVIKKRVIPTLKNAFPETEGSNKIWLLTQVKKMCKIYVRKQCQGIR